MYRLLIVDDERHIVEWLYELFATTEEWELEVLRAYDGLEALDILRKTRIDVVLSDIRMPGMSGLELIRQVSQNWPQCKVIFLTGYSEFETIYDASKYQFVSYLLKTEEDDAIIDSVRKALQLVEKEMSDKQSKISSFEPREYAQYLYDQKCIYERIFCCNDEFVFPSNTMLPIDMEKPVFIVLGRTDGTLKSKTHFEQAEIMLMLDALVGQYFSNRFNYAFLEWDKYTLLWLLQPKDESVLGGGDNTVYSRNVGIDSNCQPEKAGCRYSLCDL